MYNCPNNYNATKFIIISRNSKAVSAIITVNTTIFNCPIDIPAINRCIITSNSTTYKFGHPRFS